MSVPAQIGPIESLESYAKADTHGVAGGSWIGVDLDGTLAKYDHWRGVDHIGEPIPAMVDRVKRWLSQGKEVRILTARVAPSSDRGGAAKGARAPIRAWCRLHLGQELEITHKKDQTMAELWDDRAVQVVPNTGRRADGKKSMAGLEDLDYFAKGGPYIGPRGGKWADPKHTIPWKDKRDIGKMILDFLSSGKRTLTSGQVARSFRISRPEAAKALEKLYKDGKVDKSRGKVPEYRIAVDEPVTVQAATPRKGYAIPKRPDPLPVVPVKEKAVPGWKSETKARAREVLADVKAVAPEGQEIRMREVDGKWTVQAPGMRSTDFDKLLQTAFRAARMKRQERERGKREPVATPQLTPAGDPIPTVPVAKKPERSDLDYISTQVKLWAQSNLDPEVRVGGVQGQLILDTKGTSSASQERLKAAKLKLQKHLLQTYGHRTWVHMDSAGRDIWIYLVGNQVEGVRVGIKARLTPAERSAQLAGPAAWEELNASPVMTPAPAKESVPEGPALVIPAQESVQAKPPVQPLSEDETTSEKQKQADLQEQVKSPDNFETMPDPVPTVPVPAGPPGEQLGLDFTRPSVAQPTAISEAADKSVKRDADRVVKEFQAPEKEAKPKRQKKGKGSRRKIAVEQGKHVWGSRKDTAFAFGKKDLREMNPKEQAKRVKKAYLLPKYTPEELLDMGYTPGAVLMRRAVESAINAKAGDNLKAREYYMDGTDFVAKSLDACRTEKDISDFISEWHYLIKAKRRIGEVSGEKIEVLRDEYMAKSGNPPKLNYAEREAMKKGALVHQAEREKYSYGSSQYKLHDDRFQKAYTKYRDETRDARRVSMGAVLADHFGPDRHDLTYEHSGGVYQVYQADPSLSKAIAENHYARMAAGLGERMIKLVGHSNPYFDGPKPWRDAVRIARRWEVQGVPAETQEAQMLEAAGGKKGTRKGKGARRFKWEQAVAGIIDRRGGRRVDMADTAQLAKDFNLANLQFGDWVTEQDGESHVKGLHGALFDLADLVGIEPEAISFGGRLSFSIGGRGEPMGGLPARGHYESGKEIINITKKAGGGTVAHEWAHALDNIMSKIGDPTSTAEKQYLSEGQTRGVNPRIVEAFNNVMNEIKAPSHATRVRYEKALAKHMRHQSLTQDEADAINHWRAGYVGSNFYMDAQSFTKDMEGYWTRPRELFGRCFEAYIEDTIKDSGRVSTYLVDGTQEIYPTDKYRDAAAEERGEHAQPYPQGDERVRISAAIGNLLQVLREENALQKALEVLDEIDRLEAFAKGGAKYYTGANGGKWADPGHKTPWRDTWTDYGQAVRYYKASWPEGQELNDHEREHKAADERRLKVLKKKGD